MIYVFNFQDYKGYLSAVELERASIQKGFRSRLSEVLQCQNAYISQVFNGGSNLSLEQGLKISQFLKHNELESRYFLLLVEYARAGTKELKAFFKKDIEELQEEFLSIKSRLHKHESLSLESQSIYYSHWIYATVHILVTIPDFQNLQSLIAAISLPAEVIKEAVLFLISAGLITEKKGRLYPGHVQLHLDKRSAHIRQHHTNWRLAAIHSLAHLNQQDIHYSTVSSLSLKDVDFLKDQIVRFIAEYVKTIQHSKEESLYNFNLDFYCLLQRK